MRLFSTLIALSICGAAAGADWPRFRGPDGAGVSSETGLPTVWGPKENVLWKAPIAGRSVASPIVAGGHVYITAASGTRDDKLTIYCFEASDGKLLWQRQIRATGNTGHHAKTSMAAPTPVADQNSVYVLFATADLVALDKDGNLRWYRALAEDYPNIANQVGMASSPLLWKDTLVVPMDSNGESFLAALDARDGHNLWKTARPKDINWVTPALYVKGEKAEILFQSRLGMTAYDAASGKKLWNHATEGGTIATPIVVGEQVLMPGRGLICLRPKSEGPPEVVWTSQKLISNQCTPLVYKDHIYNVNGSGVLACGDMNGKEIWTERLKKGAYWSSPIAADDKIFICNDVGVCSVVRAGGDKPEVIATNDLKEEIMGTPAIADGRIFIQTVSGLYCIGH